MPKKNERVFPVPVNGSTDENLAAIRERTGLRDTDILRYGITAALEALANSKRIVLPIRFTLDDNPEKK